MMQCGLLGRKLGHSYSPAIHSMLGNYCYDLFETEPEEIENFLKNGNFSGINVTVPYKKDVIAHLDELSPVAERLGAVNTIVRKGTVCTYHVINVRLPRTGTQRIYRLYVACYTHIVDELGYCGRLTHLLHDPSRVVVS